jgi:hypothetical protein
MLLHYLPLSLKDLKTPNLYMVDLVFSSKHRRVLAQRKKGGWLISASRGKLDVEAVREAEAGRPDHVPSFYCSPIVFCDQGVDKCCHQDSAKISSDTKPKPASKRHEMLRPTSNFRLVLFRQWYNQAPDSETVRPEPEFPKGTIKQCSGNDTIRHYV